MSQRADINYHVFKGHSFQNIDRGLVLFLLAGETEGRSNIWLGFLSLAYTYQSFCDITKG